MIPSERKDHVILERYSPLKGHVGIISAFNFPVAVYFWNLALSLVCGNTNLWKAADSVQLCALAVTRIVARVLERNKIPGAVASMVLGPGRTVGEALINRPDMELISFTGSTTVGRHVSEVVSRRFGKKILELGGNNAMIVMEDADLDLALRAVVFAAVGTAGQRCTSLRRLFLHESVYDKFVGSLTKAYGSVKIGDPLQPGVLCGPLHTAKAVQEYEEGVAAIKKDGKVLLGGKRHVPADPRLKNGNFVEPTLAEVPHSSPMAQVRRSFFLLLLFAWAF